jgi:hypothetical protein
MQHCRYDIEYTMLCKREKKATSKATLFIAGARG